ncbi:nucleotide disphospho-sugar-binding domain-containing protein [Streptomyces noursei]|uniref:nucleotide disphospho-sugar-binding domain-containing protein n=1 Tax=Streptomyces noursei TaxID=1971 RepID=UPI0035DE028A
MRILFVTGGGPATVFALAPLATAARGAGHEVFMAGNADLLPAITASALPAIPTTDLPVQHFTTQDRAGRPVDSPLGKSLAEQGHFTGRWFGRLAAASLPALRQFGRHRRPDLIVGGTTTYAAALLAAELGVRYVRQAWDAIDAQHIHPGADEELQPELAELGRERLPEPDLFLDVCPPSLRPRHAAPARPLRFVLGNQHRPLEPWMYTRTDRPRICLTAGSQVTRDARHRLYEFLTRALAEVAPLGAEVLVAAPEALAPDLRASHPDVHAGWVPLDVVAPTCDLLVHHGGGVTSLTGMCAGTPQVIVPGAEMLAGAARALADYGAALTLPTGDDTPEALGRACRRMLADDAPRRRAQALREEIQAMPTPAATVRVLEDLTRR